MHHFKRTITLTFEGSPDLYRIVRAGFVNQGTSLNRWCIENGVNRQTAEKALKGERVSRRSRTMLATIVDEALGSQGLGA
jgi:hypothetical protein